MPRSTRNLGGSGEVDGGLVVFQYGSRSVLGETQARSELAEECNIFSASAESQVLCLTRAEGDARCLSGGMDGEGCVGCPNLYCICRVRVTV